MNLRTALMGALCAAIGAGSALWLASMRVPSRVEVRAASASPPEGASTARVLPSMPEAAVLRGIVREELAAALDAPAASAIAPVPTAAVSPSPAAAASAATDLDREEGDAQPTPAYVSTKSHVESSITRGRWTESDREQVSAALGKMSRQEREDVMREVVRALNAGMKMEAEGPPFL